MDSIIKELEKDKELLKKELLWRKVWIGSREMTKSRITSWLVQYRGFTGSQAYTAINNVKSIDNVRYRQEPFPSLVIGLHWKQRQVGVELIKLGKKGVTKAKVGRVGYSKLETHSPLSTIITESLSNAFVNAIYGFSSIVLHGTNNLANLPEILGQEKINQKKTILWLDNFIFQGKLYYRAKEIEKKLPDLLVFEAFRHRRNNWDCNDELIAQNNSEGNIDIYYQMIRRYLNG